MASEVPATLSGFATLAGVAIGGAANENSILAIHVFEGLVLNPDISYGGSLRDTELMPWGIGPQYTRYFMPANVYLSVTGSVTRLVVRNEGNSTGTSSFGLGTRVALGKEWWVGNHWGLGLVGHVSFSVNPDSSNNTSTTWAFGAGLSATYN